MKTDTIWADRPLRGTPARAGILFGRMYEDAAIEDTVFPSGARVFAIASAGCTAIRLAACREVTAVDLNPAQLEYARRRAAGAPYSPGAVERLLQWGRAALPTAGWTAARLAQFLATDDLAFQVRFWEEQLDTARFRTLLSLLLSPRILACGYRPELLSALPERLPQVMRARMARCWARHPNARNPYARALLTGAAPELDAGRKAVHAIHFVAGDAAEYLESCVPGSFDGFTLSNICDGAGAAYRRRLFAAVRHAGAPGASVVSRSFQPARFRADDDAAAHDRSILWGAVAVRPAAELGA